MSILASSPTWSQAATSTPLAVHFKLTDVELTPIPGASVRVVFGSDPRWQEPGAGVRFNVDANGEHRFDVPVHLIGGTRKRPTNFVDSLFSRAEPVDQLQIGAELEYAGHRWLYVVELVYFRRDGLVMLDATSVFTPDAEGKFSRKAKVTDAGWSMPELGGLMLTHPGHQAWNYALQPDERGGEPRRWTLELAFSRAPAPVLR